MASRGELVLRANATNVNPASYPNDSKFEQAVIYAEKALTTSTTASTTVTTEAQKAVVSGGANV